MEGDEKEAEEAEPLYRQAFALLDFYGHLDNDLTLICTERVSAYCADHWGQNLENSTSFMVA